jgi:hypothetical protein
MNLTVVVEKELCGHILKSSVKAPGHPTVSENIEGLCVNASVRATGHAQVSEGTLLQSIWPNVTTPYCQIFSSFVSEQD